MRNKKIIQISLMMLIFVSASIPTRTNAQNSPLLQQMKQSQIWGEENENRIVYTPLPQIEKKKLAVFFNPYPHLQAELKGIDFVCIMSIADRLNTDIHDSLAVKFRAEANELNLNIFYDSISYPDLFFEQIAKELDEPAFPNNDVKSNAAQVLKNNTPPLLPPYEVLKRQNAKKFYGENHPLGESYSEEGLKNINTENCNEYYRRHLKNSQKYIHFYSIPGDSTAEKHLIDLFPPALPEENPQKFNAPQNPPHNIVHFYESPQELISSDTYLNLIYRMDGLKINVQNYAVLQLSHHAVSASTGGLLPYSLTDTSDIAEFAFSQIVSQPDFSDHNMGLILPPENLNRALTAISRFMQNFKDTIMEKERLNTIKTDYINSFNNALVTPGNLSYYHNQIFTYRLPHDYFLKFEHKLIQLSSLDIQKFAKRFYNTDNYTVSIFGKSDANENQLLLSAPLAEINQYNKQDEIIKHIPYQFSAEDIIRAFLIKTGSIEPPDNQVIRINTTHEFPESTTHSRSVIYRKKNKFLQKKFHQIDSSKMQLYDTKIFDGKNAYQNANNHSQKLSGKDSLTVKMLSLSFPEQSFLQKDTQLKLLGYDTIGDKKSYKVYICKQGFSPQISYYSTEDSLKIQTEILQSEKLLRTVTFGDYIETGKKNERLIPRTQTVLAPNYKSVSVLDSTNYRIRLKNKQFKAQ